MGILVDDEIGALASDGKLISEQFASECVQPASYDLRLGDHWYSTASSSGGTLTRSNQLVIEPGSFTLVTTLERLDLPVNMRGRVGLRASHSLAGLVNISGPQIDPGFQGRLVLGIVHLGPSRRYLKHGERLFTVEFERLDRAPSNAYSGPFGREEGIPQRFIDALSSAGTHSLPSLETRLAAVEKHASGVRELGLTLRRALVYVGGVAVTALIGWVVVEKLLS